jgi:hypothetical protein
MRKFTRTAIRPDFLDTPNAVLKRVTDSSLDSMEIDENRCQILTKKLLLLTAATCSRIVNYRYCMSLLVTVCQRMQWAIFGIRNAEGFDPPLLHQYPTNAIYTHDATADTLGTTPQGTFSIVISIK